VRVELIAAPAAFLERLATADGAIVWPTFLPSNAVLTQFPRLRWVQAMTVGVEDILTPELVAAEQVALTATKGPMAESMAEHAVALLLALARHLPAFVADQQAQRWRSGADISGSQPMVELFGKTIAVLGVGEVGSALARICKAGFGMRVLGMTRTRRDLPFVDRSFEQADLHAALGEVDVVALAMPATAATVAIIDAAALAAMKPSAFLINVARGRLVDEAALVAALRSGRIAGAGLDTVGAEPLAADSPLWSLPNVVITPHIAPRTDAVFRHMVDFWCDNIRCFAAGQPLHGLVDRQAGY